MLEVILKVIFLFMAAMGGGCQEPLSISADSFRPFQRAFAVAPKGRVTELSDIRISYYRDSLENETFFRIGALSRILRDPSFDLNKPTLLYIHGYVELLTDDSVATIVEAYLRRGGYNILMLDWANRAFGNYLFVLFNIEPVGREAGKAMLKLLKRGLNQDGLHIVGHSMGSHVAAAIARYLATNGFTVKRLTGLDPAFPGFYPPVLTAPMNSQDAQFVDIIHTDGGGFGAPLGTGHADFWPNNGTSIQPGCPTNVVPLTIENFCSHWRSWEFWAESVRGGRFPSRACPSAAAFSHGDCSGSGEMGLLADDTLRGNYYLRTADKKPFALGEEGTKGPP